MIFRCARRIKGRNIMAQLRPKIVKLAKIIGGASGMLVKIDENAPEYYCMENIVSDDEADIAIAAGLRKERTAGWLAAKVGKTVAEIQPALNNLVYYGVFRRVYSEELGEDTYFMQIFAPGILEMMVIISLSWRRILRSAARLRNTRVCVCRRWGRYCPTATALCALSPWRALSRDCPALPTTSACLTI